MSEAPNSSTEEVIVQAGYRFALSLARNRHEAEDLSHILLVSTASGKICDVVDRKQPIAAATARICHGFTLSDL
jgi:hypothetical protein